MSDGSGGASEVTTPTMHVAGSIARSEVAKHQQAMVASRSMMGTDPVMASR
jgi:hypothetical protein